MTAYRMDYAEEIGDVSDEEVDRESLSARLAQIVANSPLVVCFVDLAQSRCLASSSRAKRHFHGPGSSDEQLLHQIRDRVALIRAQGLTGLHFTESIKLATGAITDVHFAVQVVPKAEDLALVLCQLDDGECVPVSIESLVPVSIRSEPVVFGAADDAFRVLRVSSDVSAMLGFDPIDVVGRSVLDLLDERLISSFISATRWVSE